MIWLSESDPKCVPKDILMSTIFSLTPVLFLLCLIYLIEQCHLRKRLFISWYCRYLRQLTTQPVSGKNLVIAVKAVTPERKQISWVFCILLPFKSGDGSAKYSFLSSYEKVVHCVVYCLAANTCSQSFRLPYHGGNPVSLVSEKSIWYNRNYNVTEQYYLSKTIFPTLIWWHLYAIIRPIIVDQVVVQLENFPLHL